MIQLKGDSTFTELAFEQSLITSAARFSARGKIWDESGRDLLGVWH